MPLLPAAPAGVSGVLAHTVPVSSHNPVDGSASQSDPFSLAPPPPFPFSCPKTPPALHQLLVTSPPAALLICLLPDAVKDSLSSEYWNSYCQELLCWQNSLSQGTAFPSGRTPRVSRSLLLQGQPALPVLGGVVRLTALALHAQEVELHRGAGVAVVAKDLHREGRERLQHQRGAHRNSNDERPEPTRDLSSSLPTPWPDF